MNDSLWQDAGQKIATKCVRVSSTASTRAVVETLVEKFRPDMKMLHLAAYALYEIHPNGGTSPREKSKIRGQTSTSATRIFSARV